MSEAILIASGVIATIAWLVIAGYVALAAFDALMGEGEP